MFTKYLLPLVALGLLLFAIVHVRGAQKDLPPVKPYAPPAESPFPGSVSGAGMVEPQTENIAVGSPSPGVVQTVSVKVGQTVEVGTELFRLDDRILQAELEIRKAAVDAARAELTRLENQPRPELVEMAQAMVDEAEAKVIDARDTWKRSKELVARHVSTEENLIQTEQAYQAARAKLAHAKSDLKLQKAGAWEYDKRVAQAAIRQAEVQLQRVATEIDRLVVRSLMEGEVLQVNVRPGEFVNTPPTQPLIVVGNVNRLHVRVDIDEYDIHRFRNDAPARAIARGNASETFDLHFVRVEPYVIPKKSLTGDNSERVDTRVLQVIYSVAPSQRRLFVGQQLDVFIDAATKQ